MLIRDVRHRNEQQPGPTRPAYRVRREVRETDAAEIVALHERLYTAEYGMDERFVQGVADTVARAIERGWPAGGGGWIVEREGKFAGCLGLTDEGDGVGRIRWVLLAPELRGTGLGRRLITEAVAAARALGMKRLELDTFSELRAAARIYRDLGFRLVSEERTSKWGPEIAYQYYVNELEPGDDRSAG